MWTEKDVKTWKRSDRENIYYVQIPGRTGWVSSGKSTKKKAIEWALHEAMGGIRPDMSLEGYSQDFFIPEICPIIRNKIDLGIVNGSGHWAQFRHLLKDYVWPKWGRYTLTAIRPREVAAWLHDLRQVKGIQESPDKRVFPIISAQTKNKILTVMHVIFDQAVFDELLDANHLRSIHRNINASRPRDVFTDHELKLLFPADRIELSSLWGSLAWAVIFMVISDAGLRPQEAAALTWENWYPDLGGFVISQATDPKRQIKGIKTAHKGMSKKPALVSKQTAKYLEEFRAGRASGLVFPDEKDKEKRPIRTDTMTKHFGKRLRMSPIKPGERILTLYCLRHSFNTSALTHLSNDAMVRDLMGHKTDAMTKNYDHPDDVTVLLRVQGQREGLEKRWQ